MNGTLVLVPESTKPVKQAPTLRVYSPGGSGPLFESSQAGLLLEVYFPDCDAVVHIDTADCDWHRLFHLALTEMSRKDAA